MTTLKDTSSVACIMDNQHTSRSYHHPILDHEGLKALIRQGILVQFFYIHQVDQASFRLIRISFISYPFIDKTLKMRYYSINWYVPMNWQVSFIYTQKSDGCEISLHF